MKDSFHGVLWLILSLLTGIFVGTCVSPFSDSEDLEVRRDTTVVYDTVKHSRLDLAGKTKRLNIPKVGKLELVYMDTRSLDTIYRNSVRYVTTPREYFYTNVDGTEIWHSGIDSRIDSLAVRRREVMITTRERQKKNSLGFGIETSYYSAFYAPAYIEYERTVKPWFSVYGRFGYNFPTMEYGMSLGIRMKLQW